MTEVALDPVLRQAGILHGLTDDAVDALLTEMETVRADRGTVIFRPLERRVLRARGLALS